MDQNLAYGPGSWVRAPGVNLLRSGLRKGRDLAGGDFELPKIFAAECRWPRAGGHRSDLFFLRCTAIANIVPAIAAIPTAAASPGKGSGGKGGSATMPVSPTKAG